MCPHVGMSTRGNVIFPRVAEWEAMAEDLREAKVFPLNQRGSRRSAYRSSEGKESSDGDAHVQDGTSGRRPRRRRLRSLKRAVDHPNLLLIKAPEEHSHWLTKRMMMFGYHTIVICVEMMEGDDGATYWARCKLPCSKAIRAEKAVRTMYSRAVSGAYRRVKPENPGASAAGRKRERA